MVKEVFMQHGKMIVFKNKVKNDFDKIGIDLIFCFIKILLIFVILNKWKKDLFDLNDGDDFEMLCLLFYQLFIVNLEKFISIF